MKGDHLTKYDLQRKLEDKIGQRRKPRLTNINCEQSSRGTLSPVSFVIRIPLVLMVSLKSDKHFWIVV